MKRLILSLIIAFISLGAFAQNNLAKLKYEDAEEAFAKESYDLVLTKLDDAEKMFGKVNAPILYLRIMAQKNILDQTNFYTRAFAKHFPSLRANVSTYLKVFQSGNAEKYKEVYKIGEMISIHPKSAEFYQAINLMDKPTFSQAVALFAKAAAKGDGYAHTRIGYHYYYGIDVDKDYGKAIEYFNKGMAMGDGSAFLYMGYCYYFGNSVQRDDKEALKYFQKAADKNIADAVEKIGDMYYNGYGVTENGPTASEYYLKAAEMEDKSAMQKIGRMYWLGKGVKVDFAKALYWFQQSAKRGYSDGMLYLGHLYYDGSGVEKDRSQAMVWYKKAADNYNAAAMYDIGKMYERGIGETANGKIAAEWYLKGAQAGDVKSRLAIGEFYELGTKGIAKDLTEAQLWYTLASEDGNEDAMIKLAKLLMVNPPVDGAGAMKWLLKASEKGRKPEAMDSIALIYRYGTLGFAKDKTKAKEWEAKAAASRAAGNK